MVSYYQAEVIKLRHNRLTSAIWLFPLIGALLAIGFSVLGGSSILKLSDETIINHWSIIWINALIATLAGLIDRNEKKATRYMIYSGHAVNLFTCEGVRIFLIATMTLMSNLLVVLVLLLNSLWAHTPSITSMGACLLAVVVTWLTTLWQIPFCLWLSRKTTLYIPIVLNTLLPLLIGTSAAVIDGWQYFPYAWTLHVLMPITHMRVNGIPLPSNSPFMNNKSILFGIVLSLGFFIVISLLTSWSFKRQEITK